MKRILITGPTGNIGFEVVRYLSASKTKTEIYAATRNANNKNELNKHYPNIFIRQLDFEDATTFALAFKQIDILFLLRPPHLSNISKVFRPLLDTAKNAGINRIVFLSVQGADKNRIIPHNKIESLVQELGFKYIFVRPSYFMQNLTTTLLSELVDKKTITLPSGKAIFNWIDAKNIGEAIAYFIVHFDDYQNEAYEITGSENKNYHEVSRLISEITGEQIQFRSINPLSFYLQKKKEFNNSGFSAIMTLLHIIPLFQGEPRISNNYKKLTGKSPTTLKEFIKRERAIIVPPQ